VPLGPRKVLRAPDSHVTPGGAIVSSGDRVLEAPRWSASRQGEGFLLALFGPDGNPFEAPRFYQSGWAVLYELGKLPPDAAERLRLAWEVAS
jgi:hypothetical protein